MKFTPFIAASIFAFVPITPCFAAPLTARNINQNGVSKDEIALKPISVAPNGMIIPGPFNGPTEKTDTGLPFDNPPDNLKDFPHIQETSQAARTTSYGYENRPAKHLWSMIHGEMVHSVMPPKQTATPAQRPHRHEDRASGYQPWNVVNHTPIDVPEHYSPMKQNATANVGRFNHEPAAFQGVTALRPGRGHGPFFNPELFSRPITIPTSTATYSNLTGGPALDPARDPQETGRANTRPVGRTHPPSSMPRPIGPRSLDSSNANWDETSFDLLEQRNPELDEYKSCMEDSVDIDELNRYTYQIMNVVYKETTGYRKGSADDVDAELLAYKPQNTVRQQLLQSNAFLRVAELQRQRLCELAVPVSQKNSIGPRDMNGDAYQKAKQEWIKAESQFGQSTTNTHKIASLAVPSIDLYAHLVPFPKGHLHNSTNNGTSYSSRPIHHISDLEAASNADSGIWRNFASAGITAVVNTPAYVATEAGDKILNEKEPEIENLWDEMLHHHKKPHNKPAATPAAAPFSNSTSAHANAKGLETESRTFSRRQLTVPKTNSTELNSDIDQVRFREALVNLKHALQTNNSTKNRTTLDMTESIVAAIYILDQAKPAISENDLLSSDINMTTINETDLDDEKIDLEKRQGSIFDDQRRVERENCLRTHLIKTGLGDMVDLKAFQELCASYPTLPNSDLFNEYVKKKGKIPS